MMVHVVSLSRDQCSSCSFVEVLQAILIDAKGLKMMLMCFYRPMYRMRYRGCVRSMLQLLAISFERRPKLHSGLRRITQERSWFLEQKNTIK